MNSGRTKSRRPRPYGHASRASRDVCTAVLSPSDRSADNWQPLPTASALARSRSAKGARST
eukprot:4196800-Prymnesium_polylepis.1